MRKLVLLTAVIVMTATATVNVTVNGVNNAPVTGADFVTTDENTTLILSAAILLANDTDVDGDALTVTAVGSAAHGTAALLDGQINYTPGS